MSDEDFLKTSKTIVQEKQEVILKESKFQSSKIIPYKGKTVRKFEFRPATWKQFIGQEEAKERAKTIVKKSQKGMKTHFLVDGIKGHGKTTFVELIAKDLNAHIIKRIGKQIDEENLVEAINEINASKSNTVMFFVDEIDSMDWEVIKILNPIIESFEYEGIPIKPFIFAGATINKYLLVQNNPDTLDRIPAHIKFSRYNTKEISIILTQYQQQLYADYKITPEVIIQLSNNCKFNPRTAICLMEDYLVDNDLRKVLKNHKIIKDGLTDIDIKILNILSKESAPIGANCLALICGLGQKEYEKVYEPFLLEYGYINRRPRGRIITEKGREILK